MAFSRWKWLPVSLVVACSFLPLDRRTGGSVVAQEKKDDKANDQRNADVIALCEAAGRGKTAEVLALIKKGVPVNVHGPIKMNRKSPLVLAILHRHLDTVKALLNRGADVHFADGSNRYPMYFCHISTVEIMKLIIAKGGDKEINLYAGATEKSPKGIGKTVLGSVCSYGQGAPEMIPILVKAGADPNKKYLILKSTPLILAIEQTRPKFDHAKYVKLLIEDGADVNLKNDKGISPLQAAVTKGNKDVVEMLQKAGAKK